MHRPLTLLWFIAVCTASPAPLYAAVIVLKTGETKTGTIVHKDARSLQINSQGMLLTYGLDDVAQIRGREILAQEISAVVPQDHPVDLSSAIEKGARGLFLEAKKDLQRLLKSDAGDHNAAQALELCNEVLNKRLSGEYVMLVFRGVSEMLNDDYAASVRSFQQALSKNPRGSDALYNLACTYEVLGSFTQALMLLEELHVLAPDNNEILYKLGECYYVTGNFNKAILCFEKLALRENKNPEVYAYLGSAYQATGNVEKGSSYARKAVKLFQAQGDRKKAQEAQRSFH